MDIKDRADYIFTKDEMKDYLLSLIIRFESECFELKSKISDNGDVKVKLIEAENLLNFYLLRLTDL